MCKYALQFNLDNVLLSLNLYIQKVNIFLCQSICLSNITNKLLNDKALRHQMSWDLCIMMKGTSNLEA